MKNGSQIIDEINVADAHPSGKRPFKREQYIEKFKSLTNGIISPKESNRFLQTVQRLKSLKAKELDRLNIELYSKFINKIKKNTSKNCIFRN